MSRMPSGVTEVHACTIVAANYSAHARVLAESFHREHPDGTFTVLVIDRFTRPFAAEPRTRYLNPDQIGIDGSELRRMAAIYDVTEFATSLKPWLLRTLLDEGRDHILYFDPDIEIFASMAEIAASAERSGIVLTPHALAPYTAAARDGERSVRNAGIYNLGFVGVGASASAFLDFWSSRLRRDCRIAVDEGIFVDQRWIDFAPAFYSHEIWRDPACNVAWWNLGQRDLAFVDGGYTVDQRPLGFFHFSGYSPLEPHILTKYQGPRPWVLLSENGALKRICDEYRLKLFAAGFEAAQRDRYGWGRLSRSGALYDDRMRRLYADALTNHEEGEGIDHEPPNPFDDEDRFLGWLNESLAPPGAMPVSRYLEALYQERTDIAERFPDLRWSSNGEKFMEWVRSDGRNEEQLPIELIPRRSVERQATVGTHRAGGGNVVGYLRAEDGGGETGRQMLGAASAAGIETMAIVESRTSTRQRHDLGALRIGTAPIYDTNIICVNADRLPAFRHDAGPGFFEWRRNIGVWWWELSAFPAAMHPAFAHLDEVWTGSRFVCDAIAEVSPIPVRIFPQPVAMPRPSDDDRGSLGLPDGFIFLFMFDFLSIVDRKNPMGIIEAFMRAFPEPDGVNVVLKSVNGHLRPYELEKLRYAAASHPGIAVMDGHVSAATRDAMMAAADCYVSLHRSEGFGLTIAEALLAGVPVIASRYSGPMEFLTDDNSFLVDCEEGRVPPGCGPYPAGARWCEPEIDQAAEFMRQVVSDPATAHARAEVGRADILDRHSQSRLAAFMAEHLGIRGTVAATVVHRGVDQTGDDSIERRAPDHSRQPSRAY